MDLTFWDIHSHIIPCVDDGSQSMETSLEILRTMEQSGTRCLVLTPHYCERRGLTEKKETIESAFSELKEQAERAQIGIELFLGSEIEYSDGAAERLGRGELLTLSGTEYILTEFAPYASAREINDAVRTLVLMGYVPVIAHAERYEALRAGMDDIKTLKKAGAMISVNVSYMAKQGLFTDRFLKSLISSRLIDFLTGDVHCTSYTRSQLERCANTVEKYSGADYARDIFYLNAEKIFRKGGN